MVLLKMATRVAKIFAIALSFLLLINSAPVLAAVIPTPPLEAETHGGSFTVDTGELSNPLTTETVVRRAILSLPSGETGQINSITITGPTAANPEGNGRIFGCVNINVKDGIDLIKACGGPAVLLPGANLRYQASGSNFGPDGDVKLKIVLRDDFNGES